MNETRHLTGADVTVERFLSASDPHTRSALERAMRRICRTLGVPPPEINAKVLGAERDFVWRAERLVVETDGAFHLPKAARERD